MLISKNISSALVDKTIHSLAWMFILKLKKKITFCVYKGGYFLAKCTLPNIHPTFMVYKKYFLWENWRHHPISRDLMPVTLDASRVWGQLNSCKIYNG